MTTSVFDLPARLSAKAEPASIGADERHFAAIADSLERLLADPTGRLGGGGKRPAGQGPAGLRPGRGGAPADRPAADAPPVQPRPLPGPDGARGRRRPGVRRAAR